jgi:hypothetical protein
MQLIKNSMKLKKKIQTTVLPPDKILNKKKKRIQSIPFFSSKHNSK